MASEPDAIADDADALKRDVAMYDQEEDAIDAFMDSASSLSASEAGHPHVMNYDNREEYSEPAVPSVPGTMQPPSSANTNQESHNQHDNNSSNTEIAFNPAGGADSAFNFSFPSMSSNQTEDLFHEQVDELCSEHLASHPQSQHQNAPNEQSNRDNEVFSRMMQGEASHPSYEDEKHLGLVTREYDQQQQSQNQSEQQSHECQSEPLKDQHPPNPESQHSYSSSIQQQQQQQQQQQSHETPDSNDRESLDPQKSSPLKQQQQQSKTPARASKTTSKSSSFATSGAKRSAPSPVSASASTSAAASDSAQPFSWNDILRVQNMIERCLQQYLSKNEILLTLKDQAQVDPEFTSVVWQKLEEQNPSFFRAYNIQLQLKEQILAFNYLVTQQKEMIMMNRNAPQAQTAAAAASSSSAPPFQVDPRGFLRSQQQHSSASTSSQRSQQQPSGSAHPSSSSASSLMTQLNLPPPSPLPLPSPIKTDLDTHAFFT